MKIANADALLRFFRFLHAYTRRLGFATTVLDDCARRGRRVLKFHFIDRFRRSISLSSLRDIPPLLFSFTRQREEE